MDTLPRVAQIEDVLWYISRYRGGYPRLHSTSVMILLKRSLFGAIQEFFFPWYLDEVPMRVLFTQQLATAERMTSG